MDDQSAAKKIESVKAYYQQQVNQLRLLTQQLAQADLAPGRRAQLAQQQETLQRDLSVFVETVLKPLAAASRDPPGIVMGTPRLGGAMVRPPTGLARPPPSNKPMPPPPSASLPSALPPPPPAHSLQAIQQQQWLFAQRVMNSRQFNDACYTQPRSRGQPAPPSLSLPEEKTAITASLPMATQAAEREIRLSRTLSQMISPSALNSSNEDRLLMVADNWLDRVIMSAVLLAKHRNAPTVAKRDLELALDRAAGVANYSTQAGLSGARRLLKRPAAAGGGGNNPHHNRMAQLRKILKSE